MAALRNITAADVVFSLAITDLYDSPQILGGFMADAAFETASVTSAEIVLGVDGIMSAGRVPYLNQMTISIMPDSPSSDIFENWQATENSTGLILPANGVIIIPATQKKYTLTKGVLTGYVPVPAAHKLLQGRAFGITWNFITPAPN